MDSVPSVGLTYVMGSCKDIGPIMGSQPGSEGWTNDMSHEAWRRLTEWFIRRYKGVPLQEETVSL